MLVLGLVDVPWWVLLLTAIIGLLWYLWPDPNYFRKHGIPCERTFPVIGTMYTLFSKPVPYIHEDLIKKHGDKKCVGGFLGNTPLLDILDADMLSEIMVKQFGAFANRMNFLSGTPMNDYNLLNLCDAHWKHVRTEMTPTFTSGKLKKMNGEINRCSRMLADSLLELAEKGSELEMKEYTGGYSMDVIASTAFGIRVNSQKDHSNEFVAHIKETFDHPKMPKIMILVLFFPKLANILLKLRFPMDIFPKATLEFFESVTKQTMEMRKSDQDQSRADFIQLMIKAQRGEDIGKDEDTGQERTSGTGLTSDEIMSNAMLFFLAGYDTTATSLSFFLYNMARYPDVQDRLMDEINEVVGDKMEVDTNVVQEMPYLDQCVSENLRMYPSLLEVNRIAKQDATVKGVFIKKGTFVNIPINAIHHDPKKWPEPDTFDPERFSAENKKNRNHFDYMPFGQGPRVCIGMRLALQSLKVAIVHVLRKVKVTKSDRTKIPLILDFNASPQLLKAKDGIFLKMEPRDA